MKQKLLLLLLGVLSALPALSRDFEYTYEGQTITYTVIDGEAKTCKTKDGYYYNNVNSDSGNHISGDLILPTNPKDGDVEYTLTSIGNYAFYKCYGLTSVMIPNSVKGIGKEAFYQCSQLKSVVIPKSVEIIGNDAFIHCNSLIKSAYPNTFNRNPFPGGFTIAYNPKGAIIEDGWVWGPNKSSIYFVPLYFEGDYTIPVSVTSIGQSAFAVCSGLTSVVIPNSVTSIGEYAFYECSGLTSVVIPNSVKGIGKEAFSGCGRQIKSAYPNTLKNPFEDGVAIAYNPEGSIIQDGWIWGPEYSAIYFAPLSLEGEFSIPESVTSIGDDAFRACSGLTSVIIPNSVTSIGDDAFRACSGLKKSAYPNTLENPFGNGKAVVYNPEGAIIQDGWIWGSEKSAVYFAPPSLEGEFSIPESVTSIGNSAFYGCSGMTSVEIPKSVTSIGIATFYGCSNLTSVTALPVTPAVMDDNAFSGLYDTIELSIPNEGVSKYLATNWSLFKNIRNTSGMELGYFSDGVLEYRLNPADATASVIGAKSYGNIQIPERFTDDSDPANPVRYYIKGIGYKAFGDKGVNSVEFNSRSEIEYIGDYTFAGSRFSSIILPKTVSYIGESAFQNSSISSIAIPEKVTAIKDSTFYNCRYLTDVQLNDTLESIGASAFSMDEDRYDRNKRYGSLTIPASMKSIGDNAFLYRGLDKVTISDLRAWCDIDFSNNDSNPCGWALDGFWLGDNEIVDLVIPDGVIEVKPYSFVTMEKLKSVKIPSSVTSIGEEAFMMNRFNDIVIPASVEYIGHRAFIAWSYPEAIAASFTKYLTYFTLEDGLNPIGIEADAFAIPTSYTGDNQVHYNTPEVFYMGRPLESLPDGFQGTLCDLTIGNTIESISDGMFANCSDLDELKLGSSIQSIGDAAFSRCRIKKVILPPSVETIGASAFAINFNLATIIMGHKVKTIGEKAFSSCEANTVSITAQTPPTAPNNTFSNYTGKLYLQGEKSKDAYYDAFTCWDRFDSYVMIDAEEIKIEGADKISGKAGDTFQLTATVWPENVTLPQIFWRSTNPEIATVDGNGLVTLHVDLESLKTRAQGEGDIDDLCTIIAETLYNDGPIAQVGVTAEDTPILAESITISQESWSAHAGETVKLAATVLPEDTTDKTVTWTSSDEAIATVDAEGNVTAVAVGEADITATCGSVSASCKVTVTPILVESLTIDPTAWSGVEGGEFTIKATVLPENADDKTLTFESSDTSVATVDAEGNVKVLKEGTCVITVSTVDGSDLKAECVVTGLSGVDAIFADPNVQVNVYDLNGVMLKKGCSREELKQLKPAVYILRSGDTVVKAVVR